MFVVILKKMYKCLSIKTKEEKKMLFESKNQSTWTKPKIHSRNYNIFELYIIPLMAIVYYNIYIFVYLKNIIYELRFLFQLEIVLVLYKKNYYLMFVLCMKCVINKNRIR